jgi:hypothetical protein
VHRSRLKADVGHVKTLGSNPVRLAWAAASFVSRTVLVSASTNTSGAENAPATVPTSNTRHASAPFAPAPAGERRAPGRAAWPPGPAGPSLESFRRRSSVPGRRSSSDSLGCARSDRRARRPRSGGRRLRRSARTSPLRRRARRSPGCAGRSEGGGLQERRHRCRPSGGRARRRPCDPEIVGVALQELQRRLIQGHPGGLRMGRGQRRQEQDRAGFVPVDEPASTGVGGEARLEITGRHPGLCVVSRPARTDAAERAQESEAEDPMGERLHGGRVGREGLLRANGGVPADGHRSFGLILGRDVATEIRSLYRAPVAGGAAVPILGVRRGRWWCQAS